jgi:hypothetical protein
MVSIRFSGTPLRSRPSLDHRRGSPFRRTFWRKEGARRDSRDMLTGLDFFQKGRDEGQLALRKAV